MTTTRFQLAALSVSCAVFLAACSGGDSPVIGATANLAVGAVAANVVAINNTPLIFPTGIPAFGTTVPTTVNLITPASGAQSFSAASGGLTASGPLRFGSCIFQITASTYPVGSPLAQGQTVTVANCTINAATSGKAADGTSTATPVSVTFGAVNSTPTTVAVTINSNGSVTIGNVVVGTVVTGTITGG